MSKKWLNFHSLHSPLKVTVTTEKSAAITDWPRVNWENIFVNGETVQSHMDKDGVSKENLTEQQLGNFFKKIILAQVPEEKKDAALAYLMASFHQGGLIYPVTAAIAHLCKDTNLSPSASGGTKQVNIVPQEFGFIIQEISIVKQFNYNDPKGEARIIVPDAGQNFCIKAQATINVSVVAQIPSIEVVNQSISYGNSEIKSIADTRNWFTKFTDFIKNIFNANSVLDLSPVKKEENPSTAPNLEKPDKTENPLMAEIEEAEHQSGMKL